MIIKYKLVDLYYKSIYIHLRFMVLIYKQIVTKQIGKCYKNIIKYYKSSNIYFDKFKKLIKGWGYAQKIKKQ